MRSIALPAGLAVLAFVAAGPASAETKNFMAMISPSTEVPPVANSKATGHLDATYDSDTHTLTYTVAYADLTGAPKAAHFHGPAPAGKNAGVLVPISGELASPLKGTAKLTDDQAKALMNGDLYFNIHTAANPNGEMRGQLVPAK